MTVSHPTLLVEAGHDSSKSFLFDGVRGGSATELGRGVAEKRRLLRHHHLLGAVIRDALVLDIAQVPLREDGRGVPEEMKTFRGVRGVVCWRGRVVWWGWGEWGVADVGGITDWRCRG